jgi:hypothetical protein
MIRRRTGSSRRPTSGSAIDGTNYMKAYEEALSKTTTNHAPWSIVPADHKWFTRLAIARLVVEALESLDLAFPKAPRAQREALAEARKRLRAGA